MMQARGWEGGFTFSCLSRQPRADSRYRFDLTGAKARFFFHRSAWLPMANPSFSAEAALAERTPVFLLRRRSLICTPLLGIWWYLRGKKSINNVCPAGRGDGTFPISLALQTLEAKTPLPPSSSGSGSGLTRWGLRSIG